MTINRFIHWGNIAAIAAGVALIGAELAYVIFGNEDITAMTTGNRVSSALFYIGAVLLVPGAIGLYMRQMEQAGMFGFVAFVLALLGSSMMQSSDWTEFFAVPQMVDAGIEKAEGIQLLGLAINFITYSLGWLLFGIASLRAKVLPRAASIALIVTVLLNFFVLDMIKEYRAVELVVWLPWYGAYLWMGASHFSKPQQSAEQLMSAPIAA
jgi:hypothetical protein